MVSNSDALEIMLADFPNFREYRQEELDAIWAESNIFTNLVTFAHYIRDLLIDNKESDKLLISRAFALAESWLNEGTEELQTAVATGFLESVINAVAWERISASSFIHLLGPESKKHCKAWDEFTGVKTEGLWD